jgi:hypothetical protein
LIFFKKISDKYDDAEEQVCTQSVKRQHNKRWRDKMAEVFEGALEPVAEPVQ